MKAFATVCLLGVLVAAFSIVAVIAHGEAEAANRNDEALPAPGTAPAVPVVSPQLLAVMRELLDGREVECERILGLLLGLDEGEALDNEQLVRLLLGLDDREDLDTEDALRLLEDALAGGSKDS